MSGKDTPQYAGVQFMLPGSIGKTRSKSTGVLEVSTGTYIATLEERNQKLSVRNQQLFEENTTLAASNRMLVADNVEVKADRKEQTAWWSQMYEKNFKSIHGIMDKYKDTVDGQYKEKHASLTLMLGNRDMLIEEIEEKIAAQDAQIAAQDALITQLRATLLYTCSQHGGAGSSS